MSRKEAAKIAVKLIEAGYRTVFAGGAVRDRLLGRDVADVDVATDAEPSEVVALFPRSVPVGEAFGVVKVVTDDGTVDVATFRRDVGIADGRRPAHVERATLEQDVERRDFTINGLMEDPLTGDVIDLVGGLDDLRARRVRAIGEPGLRFREDGLRLLRGVRFATVLGFEIEHATARAMHEHASMLRRVSGERVRAELERMFVSEGRGRALELLEATGLLVEVLPEVDACARAARSGDACARRRWEHVRALFDVLGEEGDEERDEEEPAVASRPASQVTFALSLALLLAESSPDADPGLAESVCARLRCATALTRRVVELVAARKGLSTLADGTRAALRRLAGSAVCAELALWEDALARVAVRPPRLRPVLVELVQSLRGEALVPPPFLTGADVLAEGIPPGPRVGELVRTAHDLQLEGSLVDREAALSWMQARLAESR